MNYIDPNVVVQSGQFDPQWYGAYYRDVALLGMDPIEHYLWIGHKLGRFPNLADLQRASGVGLRWCIIATPHVLFIAHSLAEILRQHGWSVQIVLEPPAEFNDDYYIVLCAQMFERLPPGEKRIIYQLEQSASSRWFSDDYLSAMENSLGVLDYSLQNIDFLEGKGIAYPQVFYLPIGASPTYRVDGAGAKDIDVLFYGDYKSCPRRQRLLDLAETRFRVTRADSVFGDDMKQMIARSKVVLNLHYYEGAQLEMPRIQECLSLGVPVVSEGTSDQGDYPGLEPAVCFFGEGDGQAMLTALSRILTDQTQALAAVDDAVAHWNWRLRFMVDRFLIGIGILPADALDRMVTLPVEKNALFSLSLPETIKRRRVFEVETKTAECVVFDGIRRRPGWIGCGMSYKYLCASALKAGVDTLIIMEDDVLFSADHAARMEVVHEFLSDRMGQWDIFSGVVAHLHEDAKVINVETYKGIDFVTIDRMTSTVFNIYSERAMQKICAWDPMNEDATSNTIDRYLENANLRIVLTDPYLVGHREEMHSTLWGFQNTQYRDMIAESQRQLNVLKRNWLAERLVRQS